MLKLSNLMKKSAIALSTVLLIGCGGAQDNGDKANQKGSEQQGKSTVAQLIEATCATAENCDSTLEKEACIVALNKDGSQVWDNFGLNSTTPLTTAEILTGIEKGDIVVAGETALQNCYNAFPECDNEGEDFPIGSYENVEKVIPPDRSCSVLFFAKSHHDTSAVTQLIEAVCVTATNCDPTLNRDDCVFAMYQDAGLRIWDNFGLHSAPPLSTAQVVTGVEKGDISVASGAALEECYQAFPECDNEGEGFPISSYEEVEKVIPQNGSCDHVLSL